MELRKKMILLGLVVLAGLLFAGPYLWAWDDDGGNKPYVAGTCYVGSSSYSDVCLSGHWLKEYYPINFMSLHFCHSQDYNCTCITLNPEEPGMCEWVG